jgi:hypothetical protein
VIAENPKVTTDRCECGALLAWESRGTQRLALCRDPRCGLITADTADDDERGHALQRFLLGDVRPTRYVSPWVRAYFKAAEWGYGWRPHVHGCRDCGSEIVAALDLAWRRDRPGDPYHAALCVRCGATETTFWIDGKHVSLWTGGSAWDVPAPPILALKHALRDRAEDQDRTGGFKWDFA